MNVLLLLLLLLFIFSKTISIIDILYILVNYCNGSIFVDWFILLIKNIIKTFE